MGTDARLPRKDELRYRRGSTNESQNCRHCKHIITDYEIRGSNGELMSIEPRCTVMGLQPGRRYRVRIDHTCDAQEFNAASMPKWAILNPEWTCRVQK